MIDPGILDEVLEGLLLVSGGGLKISEIAEHLEIKTADVNVAIKRLKEKYGGKSGIYLITYNGKAQFASNPAYSDLISLVLNPIRERDLSAAALETIAIIAYRQPVTRLDIEQIRGVNSEYTVQMLLKNNLIEVVGRKEAVGKPLLFGTTDEFLKRFRLESLDQLPDYETLLESIKVIESVRDNKSIYNEFEIPDEAAEEAAATVDPGADSGADAAENAPETEKAKKPERVAAGKKAEEDDDFEFPDEEVPDFLKDEKDLKKIE